MSEKKYKVSIVECCSYNNREVKKALEQSLKNINFKFKKNLKVLIKPNVLGGFEKEKAITTHPVILEELCKILKKHNAEIYIGDSSDRDTKKALETAGFSYLSKYGKIIPFEGLSKTFFKINNQKIPLPDLLKEVDIIINVAKLKTHILTKATLSVKNLFGCISGKLKSDLHKKFPQEENFSRLLSELADIVKPKLNIIDGVTGIEGNGPGTTGKIKKSNLIITGKNPFALDIIASEVMGFNPYDIFTNKFSDINRKEIEVIGKKPNLNFQKPRLSKANPIIRPLVNLIPKPKISFNKNCTKCKICQEKCPVNAITIKEFPECDHKKCIRCLCCIEVCPSNAIYLKESGLKENLKKVYNKIVSF
ncbi:DUF362 domain-containing protein [Candidatus Pacearchaeota archaeon]|nr:DUF362 domain-containing protein [Candidatus Pacearchaeota archaeon]MBD3283396.1 DUF362 domain-containing protein [Candidatus Pacearchaeota archaeon]